MNATKHRHPTQNQFNSWEIGKIKLFWLPTSIKWLGEILPRPVLFVTLRKFFRSVVETIRKCHSADLLRSRLRRPQTWSILHGLIYTHALQGARMIYAIFRSLGADIPLISLFSQRHVLTWIRRCLAKIWIILPWSRNNTWNGLKESWYTAPVQKKVDQSCRIRIAHRETIAVPE